jgi:hypothetical protein
VKKNNSQKISVAQGEPLQVNYLPRIPFNIPIHLLLFSFFFAMSQFDWAITRTQMKTWSFPQNRTFYFEEQLSFPFGPPITYSKGCRGRFS